VRRIVTAAIYALSAVIGLVAFTYPFWLPQFAQGLGRVAPATSAANAHQGDAPLLTMLLLFICLGTLLIEVQGQTVSAKIVAALGVLVAIASVLRFIEVAVPGPGGFSLIFAPLILCGYVFGARFGFLLGVLSMLVSALVTANVGPWLPYQMFAAGWVGLTAGWLPQMEDSRLRIVLLALFSMFWGLLFGAIMNLYFWPFITGGSDISWEADIDLGEGIRRYVAFYIATSLVWDIGRALGNGLFVLALGAPAIRALARFRDRFEFQMA